MRSLPSVCKCRNKGPGRLSGVIVKGGGKSQAASVDIKGPFQCCRHSMKCDFSNGLQIACHIPTELQEVSGNILVKGFGFFCLFVWWTRRNTLPVWGTHNYNCRANLAISLLWHIMGDAGVILDKPSNLSDLAEWKLLLPHVKPNVVFPIGDRASLLWAKTQVQASNTLDLSFIKPRLPLYQGLSAPSQWSGKQHTADHVCSCVLWTRTQSPQGKLGREVKT